jgi:hypothetical protein
LGEGKINSINKSGGKVGSKNLPKEGREGHGREVDIKRCKWPVKAVGHQSAVYSYYNVFQC